MTLGMAYLAVHVSMKLLFIERLNPLFRVSLKRGFTVILIINGDFPSKLSIIHSTGVVSEC